MVKYSGHSSGLFPKTSYARTIRRRQVHCILFLHRAPNTITKRQCSAHDCGEGWRFYSWAKYLIDYSSFPNLGPHSQRYQVWQRSFTCTLAGKNAPSRSQRLFKRTFRRECRLQSRTVVNKSNTQERRRAPVHAYFLVLYL